MAQSRLVKSNAQLIQKPFWNGEHRLFYTWNAGVVKDLRSEGLESRILLNFINLLVP